LLHTTTEEGSRENSSSMIIFFDRLSETVRCAWLTL
jgi:hypothetical protein